jgi:hypothetical protein
MRFPSPPFRVPHPFHPKRVRATAPLALHSRPLGHHRGHSLQSVAKAFVPVRAPDSLACGLSHFPQRHARQQSPQPNVTQLFASQTSVRALSQPPRTHKKSPRSASFFFDALRRPNHLKTPKFLHSLTGRTPSPRARRHKLCCASILYPLSARPRSSWLINFCLSVTHSGTSLPSCIRAYST